LLEHLPIKFIIGKNRYQVDLFCLDDAVSSENDEVQFIDFSTALKKFLLIHPTTPKKHPNSTPAKHLKIATFGNSSRKCNGEIGFLDGLGF